MANICNKPYFDLDTSVLLNWYDVYKIDMTLRPLFVTLSHESLEWIVTELFPNTVWCGLRLLSGMPQIHHKLGEK